MLKVLRVGLLALACGGCGDNLVPAVTTRTQVIPSKSGDHMAYVLEPLLITAIHEPWSMKPFAYTETGPTMLVDLATDQPITSFAVGMTHVVMGDDRAWILQSTSAEWSGASPTAEPTPRTMSMSIVDRNTLQVGHRVMLEPPIDVPVAIGHELLDVSRTGSAIGEVVVRLRHDSGKSQILTRDTGSHPVWCNGDNHLVYAFQTPSNAVRILDISRTPIFDSPDHALIWGSGATELEDTALGTAGIACDRDGKRIVIEVRNANETSLQLLDLASGTPAFSLAGLAAPFAITTDGNAVVARRTSDDRFVRVMTSPGADRRSKIGTISLKELDLFATRRTLTQPVQVGNEALFSTGDEYHVVDLSTGIVGGALAINGVDSVRVIPWDGHGFALMSYHDVEMNGVGVLTSAGLMPMSLPPFVRDPQLLAASGSRMYVAASNESGDRQVYGFDPNKPQGPVSNASSPECNPRVVPNGHCL